MVQVHPSLTIYDAACKLRISLEEKLPGVLDNGGRLPRVTNSAQATNDDGLVSEMEDGNGRARVCLPQLAHFGTSASSATGVVTRPTVPIEPVHNSDADAYALKEASYPQPVAQSEVDLDDLLYHSAQRLGRVGKLRRSAAARSLAS